MTDIGGNLTAIFGGLLSGGIGFFIIALVMATLVVTYLLMYQGGEKNRDDERTAEKKY